MSKNWNLIRKKGIWSETLADLIQEAKAALKASSTERSAVRADLRDFIDQSPDFDDSIPVSKYDEIASKLHKQLVQADLEDELAKMESRQPVYSEILQEIRCINDDANAAADAISLNRVRKVVDSVADAVDSLKELRDEIDKSDEPKLAKSLDELLTAFSSLRNVVKS
jgi:hypothetical protein